MPACCEPFFDSLGKPQGAIILFKIFKSCSVNGDKDLIIKGKKDMNIAKAMQLLGAAGYIFLSLALLSGILILTHKAEWLKFKWHMRLGIAAFILATLHVVVVMLNY